jgi:MFS family permease
LRTRNYRLFASGQLISNTGAWVQRIAQDWLVLTLTGSATAVGITVALQFLPTLLFGLYGGVLADRYPKRRTLLCTQAGMALMAAVLAALALSHTVAAWHVYLVAFGLGTVASIDNPARQAFVNEMVGPDQLRNAISLNSSIFQLGGLIGPAISGALLGAVGPGWAFAINAASYGAPAVALMMMRTGELFVLPTAARRAGQLREGLRYVAKRNDVLWPLVLAGVFGFFSMNLTVSLAAYAKSVFHSGASGYGLLSSLVAVGALTGGLISARRRHSRLRGLVAMAIVFATVFMLAPFAPGEAGFAIMLVPLGAISLIFATTANATIQLATDDAIRGRVMGVYLLVAIGSGALGGTPIGWFVEHVGPRYALLLSGLVPLLVTLAVALRLAREGRLRLQVRPLTARPRLLAVVPR